MVADVREKGGENFRVPKQARSRAAMERIISAAEDLVNVGNYETTSIQDIAQKAGVSVGSFYARFPTKDALLVTLYERYLDRTEKDLNSLAMKAKGDPYRDRVKRVISYMGERWIREKGMVKAFLLHFRGNPVQGVDHLEPRLIKIFADWCDFLSEPALAQKKKVYSAAEVALAMLLSVMREEIIFDAATPMRQNRGKAWSQLYEGLEDMATYYLERAEDQA